MRESAVSGTDEIIRGKRLDAVNRIKYEHYEEFEESLFADVYEKAVVLTSYIVDANLRDECEKTLDGRACMEEQYSNIIAFLGERGMGKSSAMLSFALFLKKYDDKKIEGRYKLSCKIPFEINHPLKFYVLPRIDAAMLVKGENLIDIVLAKMWSDFRQRIDESMGQQSEGRETRECFEAVKKSYEVYQRAVSGRDDRNMTSIRQMDELARCLNLRNDFRKLVNAYLEYMSGRCSCSFFVLTIDDLDIVSGRTDEILEQIRLFLMVPKVIVLATADYGRLYLECNKSLSSSLICPGNIEEREKRQIRGYTEKYLAKIFPSNMRIHMPRLNVIGGIPFTLNVQELGIIEQEKNASTTMDQTEDKQALFWMIAYYSGIMMYPFDNHLHILQKQSLRAIVNELFELKTLKDMSEQSRFRAVCRWMQTALIDYGRTVTDEKTHEQIQIFLGREAESFFDVTAEVLLSCIAELAPEKAARFRHHENWAGYGRIMLYLYTLEKERYHGFVQFVLVWYSVQLSEAMRCIENIEQDGTDIFYSILEEKNYSEARGRNRLSPDKISTTHLQLVLAVSPAEDVEKWMLDNLDMICDAFRVANLGGWNLWNSDGADYLQLYAEKIRDNSPMFEIQDADLGVRYREKLREGKIIIKITAGNGLAETSKSSFEIMLYNALEYREHLEGFLANIYKALSRLAERTQLSGESDNPEGEDGAENVEGPEDIEAAEATATSEGAEKTENPKNMTDVLNRIMRNEKFEERMHLKQFDEWKNGELCSKLWEEWLPLESMEVMLHLAEEICKINAMSYSDNLLERVINFQSRQLEKIIAELEKVEKYYSPVEGEKYEYAIRWRMLQKIVDPYNIGESFIRMAPDAAGNVTDANGIGGNTEI